jgi:hypothetical protein
MKRAASQEIQSETKRFHGGPPSTGLTSYEDILSALETVPLNIGQMLNLSKKLEILVGSQINLVTQNFPSDLWNTIFQKAGLPKLPPRALLPLRTVCTTWNKIICSFTKLNTMKTAWISNLFDIFPLRSLILGPSTIFPDRDLSLLTNLSTLKIVDPATTGFFAAPKYSPDLSEFGPLTNLTKLSLTSRGITSLGPLTGLQCLSLVVPFRIKPSEVSRLPNLTKLVSNQESFFEDCRWTGHGVSKDGNREVLYEGSFKDGEYDGFGRETYEGGHTYQGNFKNGMKHGYGVQRYADGQVYEGDFENDDWHGFGRRTHPDGIVYYEGSYQNGVETGEGVLRRVDGVTYRGTFVGRVFHGQGTMCYTDGTKYVGEFDDGERHGNGIFYYADGDSSGRIRYEGSYRSGVADGPGVLYFRDGTKQEGEYWQARGGEIELDIYS